MGEGAEWKEVKKVTVTFRKEVRGLRLLLVGTIVKLTGGHYDWS
jgi:hypothetical protein